MMEFRCCATFSTEVKPRPQRAWHLRKPESVVRMTLDFHKLEALRSQLEGGLILPGNAQYDVSREIWNRCFDRRPGVIVRCTAADDVIAGGSVCTGAQSGNCR